ncbi:MAG: DUF5666 domain-containing protein [Terriglobales bacterium]
MKAKRATIATFVLSVVGVPGASGMPAEFAPSVGQAQDAGQPAVARRIGAIKTINGNAITLAPDSGPEVAVTVQPNARLLRIAPGAKDLTNATPIQLQDLQAGDRVRVRGQATPDGSSIAALEIIVISHSDLEARHAQERQDWQKRGLGGLVSAVDASTGTVTISVTSLGGKKEIAVHTSKTTAFRRYAPDSVKFDDARPSSLQEIQSGDQLRARGTRSADGSELTAEEVVTGSFRNIAGTVNSTDASAGTLIVQDLLSKKAVPVKITPESQLHKLPPEMAQRIAARLKGSMPPGTPGAAGSVNSSSAPVAANNGQSGSAPNDGTNPGSGAMGGGMRQGGAPDLQQMLNRMPAVTLADLHKGDAVLIVTTLGSTTEGGTAITLLSGVEPILQAAPSGSQAMMLAPWSLGGAPSGDAGP